MSKRKFLHALNELIDRLSIYQLKEVFIPEHKEYYKKEISDILHDIDLIIQEDIEQGKGRISAKTIRAIIVISQINAHIWYNESKVRNGEKGGNLHLTHGLNGIRNVAGNIISECVGGRKDYKTDCLAAEFKDWEISWDD